MKLIYTHVQVKLNYTHNNVKLNYTHAEVETRILYTCMEVDREERLSYTRVREILFLFKTCRLTMTKGCQ